MPIPVKLRLISLTLSASIPLLAQPSQAIPPDPGQLVEQSISLYKTADYQSAIAKLTIALKLYQQANDRPNTAIVQENLARTYQQLGQSDQALLHWQQVIPLHQNNPTKLGRALTEQAQTYSNLGQPKTAIELLCHKLDSPPTATCAPTSALSLAKATQDKDLETAALGSLGEAYRLLGKTDPAITHLKLALHLAQQQNNPAYQISALNSLANTHTSLAQLHYQRAESAQRRRDSSSAETQAKLGLDNDNIALRHLEDSLKLAQGDPQASIRAILSLLPIHSRQKNQAEITNRLTQARQLLNQSPNNRQRIYASIDLARQSSCAPDAEALLNQAVSISEQIGDRRATSFALGALGKLYECQGNLTSDRAAKTKKLALALTKTQAAIQAAEPNLKAKDSLYQWEWQTGRILKATGQTVEAIKAYKRSIAILDSIRSDILNANRDLQFDFRDTIDPIYRDLIALQLGLKTPDTPDSQTPALQSTTPTQNLTTILATMDSLQLAELQNYFGSECVITAVSQLDSKDSLKALNQLTTTAIISSIILDDRAVMILKLPNQAPKGFAVGVGKVKLEQKINALRSQLEDYTKKEDFNLQESKDLYNLLIRPLAQALEGQSIDTLVFVQDGILRSVPMAALHNGDKFLVEQYAIATTPSLTLTDLTTPDRSKLQALALGVTQATKIDSTDFPALQFVEAEINGLKQQLPGSQSLLNKDFREDRIQQILNQKSFPILHIATHGQFGADPEDTFLVTGDVSKKSKLTIADLDILLRQVSKSQAPDLLMLTACQTAVGDDRSTLGLAGAAVRAGSRSAIASLWFVDDLSTASLVNAFYGNLPKMSKAQALQKAQKQMIQQGDHPAYWAALVLVGNWL